MRVTDRGKGSRSARAPGGSATAEAAVPLVLLLLPIQPADDDQHAQQCLRLRRVRQRSLAPLGPIRPATEVVPIRSDFKATMGRLFDSNKIHNEAYGRQSKPSFRLAIGPKPKGDDCQES